MWNVFCKLFEVARPHLAPTLLCVFAVCVPVQALDVLLLAATPRHATSRHATGLWGLENVEVSVGEEALGRE